MPPRQECADDVNTYQYTLLTTFFMSLFLSSVTSYLELRNAISVYCISRILPADIKLVVWTVLIGTRITTILSKTLHQ